MHVPVCLSVCLSHVNVCGSVVSGHVVVMPVRLSVSLFLCLSVRLSICLSHVGMCGGVVVRPCRDGASASGRGVLSMHGLSHGVVRVNTGSNLTSLTLQDCGQVLPGGLYISPYVSVCLLHICRTVDRCCQKVCISLRTSVCLSVCHTSVGLWTGATRRSVYPSVRFCLSVYFCWQHCANSN